MQQRLSLVTLGVADVDRARAFYEALGWTAGLVVPGDVTFFQLDNGLILGLWGRDELAADSCQDAAPPPGAIVLAHNVPDADAVDATLAAAAAAGATVHRAGAPTEWGGYSGLFTDPDGHPWEIACNPAWVLTADGRTLLGAPGS